MPISKQFAERLYPNLPRIASGFGTPIHVLDQQGIINKIDILQVTMQDIHGFKEFFAVKACPIPAVLRIMKGRGCGFDCSSISELILARQAGAEPEDIMFTSNNTTYEEFEVAMSNGGCILNLDDVSFLDHPYFKDHGFPETICFRVNPGPLRADESVIGKPEEAKYGIMMDQIPEAYGRAREMGAKKFGVHTMICSGDLDFRNMVKTVEMLVNIALSLGRESGIELSFMNVGGGIGIPYHPDEESFRLDLFAMSAERVLYRAWGHLPVDPPALFMESGRFMTGPHGVFVARAINAKHIYQTHIGVDGAMTGNPRPAVYDAYHHITVVDKDGKQRMHGSDVSLKNVVGPICENCDRLATQRELPSIHIGEKDGDFIISHDCGAHAIAMPSNYNGRPRHGAVMLTSNNMIERVMHAETVQTILDRTKGL